MKSISTLKLALRFTLGFGLIALIITALSAFSFLRVSQITSVVEQQNHLRTEKLERLYTAREALDQTGLAARNAFIFPDGDRAREELDLLDKEKAIYVEALTAMTPLFQGEDHFAKVRSGLLSMADELRRPRKYREAGQMAEYGKFLVEECSPLRRRIGADIAVVIKELQQQVDTGSRNAERLSSQSQTVILAVAAGALLLSILIGWILTRSLLHQLGGEPEEVTRIARDIAHGDLTAAIPVKHGDSASVMHAMQDMRDNLVKIVSDVRTGTEAIAKAASGIAAGNLNLSSRTEEQAASLEETASAMEQLTSTVARNAQNAEEANALARSATSVAGDGGSAVARVVETMSKIDDSSRRISDITSVIDGIAFQTNILALNAAVEAARAGEQGRGFAVVASEVRALAQRSAAAAKEIKDLIGNSVDMVALGSRQAGEAGETMTQVVSGVQKMAGVMAEIMEASRQQSSGIVEVSQTIVQIDGSTQQNATLVQEAAAAAASLQHQAEKLSGSVNFFRLASAAAAPLTSQPATASTNTPPIAAPRMAKPVAADATAREAPLRAASLAVAPAKSSGRALRTGPQPKPRIAPHQSDADWTEF